MMKKIIYTLAIVFTIVLTSCSDWLEVLPPQDLVQDEYWQTQEDAEAVLMAAYKKMSILDEYWFMAGELRADMVSAVSGDYLQIDQGRILPTNNLCKWDQYYEIINYCNFVMEFAPEAEEIDNTFTPIELEGMLAEARFIRAWVYFFMVKMYGDVPFSLKASKTDNQDFFLEKTEGNEILEYISNDILGAKFTDDYGDLENNKGRASKAAAHALLADIYLWRGAEGDYERCIAHIDSIDQTKYVLLPGGLWFENFYPGNSLESIMELQLGWLNGTANSLYDLTTGTNPSFQMTEYTLELLYEREALEEIRNAGSIIPEVTGGRPEPFKVLKYSGTAGTAGTALRSTGSEQRAANFILYRLADLLLMKAEALIQLDRYSEAYDYINIIRTRAGVMPYTNPASNHDAAEDVLLEERARELAFEGKRWWDLVRMGKRNNYARERDFIKMIIESLPISQQLVLENRLLNRDGWYWPIHDSELDRNKNIEQNSYYAPFSKDRD